MKKRLIGVLGIIISAMLIIITVLNGLGAKSTHAAENSSLPFNTSMYGAGFYTVLPKDMNNKIKAEAVLRLHKYVNITDYAELFEKSDKEFYYDTSYTSTPDESSLELIKDAHIIRDTTTALDSDGFNLETRFICIKPDKSIYTLSRNSSTSQYNVEKQNISLTDYINHLNDIGFNVTENDLLGNTELNIETEYPISSILKEYDIDYDNAYFGGVPSYDIGKEYSSNNIGQNPFITCPAKYRVSVEGTREGVLEGNSSISKVAASSFDSSIGNRIIGVNPLLFFTKTEPIEVKISGKKILEKRDLQKDEFSFLLKGEGKEITATNNENGDIEFNLGAFDKEGTYTYEINEVIKESQDTIYDEHKETVTVVIKNTDGVLEADIKTDEDGVVFTNKKVPSSVAKVQIKGQKKVIKDVDIPVNHEFKFVLKEGDNIIAETSCKSDISFDIEYTEPGRHEYTIEEDKRDDYECDEHIETVIVDVYKDDDDLVGKVQYDEDGVVFENKLITYKDVEIEKLNSYSTRVVGAEIAIVNANDEPLEIRENENKTWTCQPHAEIMRFTTTNGSYKTPAMLPIYLSNGEKAQYHLYETVIPDGYKKDMSSWYQKQALEEWKEYPLLYGGNINVKYIRCANTNASYDIQIQKTVFHSKFEFNPDISSVFQIELKDENGKPVNDSFYYVNKPYEEYIQTHYTSDNPVAYMFNNFTEEKTEANSITFKDGIGLATVPAGGSITIFNVPENYTFNVTELTDAKSRMLFSQIATNIPTIFKEYYEEYYNEFDNWRSEGVTFIDFLKQKGVLDKYPNIKAYGKGVNTPNRDKSDFVWYDTDNILFRNMGSYYSTQVFNADKINTSFSLSANKNINNYDKTKFSVRLTDKDNVEIITTSFDKDGKAVLNNIPIEDINYRTVEWNDMTDEEKQKVKKLYGSRSYPFIVVDEMPDDAFAFLNPDVNPTEEQIKEYDFFEAKYGSKAFYETFDGAVYYKDANEEQKEHMKKYGAYYNFTDNRDEVYTLYSKDSFLDGTIYAPNTEAGLFGLFYDDEREYYLSEIIPEEDNGVTYDTHQEKVKVKITGEYGEEPVVSIEYENGEPVFNNIYDAKGKASITGTKKLKGKKINDDDFSFELKKDNKVIETVSNKGETFTFSDINYTLSDIGTHTYTVVEKTSDKPGITYDTHTENITIEVSDNGDGTLKTEVKTDADGIAFNNTYNATGGLVLTGKKTLENKNMDTFSFELREGDRLIETATNDKNGNISFKEIAYTLNDVGTHTYTVTEVNDSKGGVTYDTHTETITVEVTDNGDGTLKAEVTNNNAMQFINKYAAGGNVLLTGTKKLTGKEMDSFRFELKENDKLIETVNNAESGQITFKAINYTLEDVGTHTYTITEVNDAKGGVEYDTHTETVKVEVKDNGDGTLKTDVITDEDGVVFNNKYSATGSITFEGKKDLEGKAMDTFEFILSEDKEIETVTNDENGEIVFSTINYTLDDVGTHTYTVTEKDTSKDGISYDTHTETVTVEVTDNGDGTLKVTPVFDEDGVIFENTYSATGKAVIEGNKKLIGANMKEFEFVLKEDGKEIAKANNSDGGVFAFPEIEYVLEDVGEHTYTVEEINTEIAGITYDEHIETIKVNVTDNGDGTLKTEVVYDEDGNIFTNIYETEGVVELKGAKELEGSSLKEGQFRFALIKNGETIQETVNDAEGNFAFSPFTYNAEDEYKITEINDAQENIIYDTHEEEIRIEAKDNGDGTMEITSNEAIFKNKYEAPAKSIEEPNTQATSTGDTNGMIPLIILSISAIVGMFVALRTKKKI